MANFKSLVPSCKIGIKYNNLRCFFPCGKSVCLCVWSWSRLLVSLQCVVHPCSCLNTLFQMILTIYTRFIKEHNLLTVNMCIFTNQWKYWLLLWRTKWEKSHQIPLKNPFWDLLYNLWETLSMINSCVDFLFIRQMLNITLFLSLCTNICINSQKLRSGHLRHINATRLLSYISISAFMLVRVELIM